ncbi:MAG: hypothetical protein JWO77_1053 [Ilumatobacteraceae bacterium]|nr:hypothetical protein [Ilumatobacteraceae bacterium]
MHYMVLLYDNEANATMPGDPEFEALMAGYTAFGELGGTAIVGGDALVPAEASRAIRVTGGQVSVTDGPYAESSEVLGGYYVLDVPTLDDAIELVRHIPATATGSSEIRPIAMLMPPSTDPVPAGAVRYVATIHGPTSEADVPGTAAWDERSAAHGRFASEAGSAVAGGAAIQPSSTASTVRVRDGELLVTDGPFAEGAEVVGGVYLLTAAPDAVVDIAARIPVPDGGGVDLRPILELGG